MTQDINYLLNLPIREFVNLCIRENISTVEIYRYIQHVTKDDIDCLKLFLSEIETTAICSGLNLKDNPFDGNCLNLELERLQAFESIINRKLENIIGKSHTNIVSQYKIADNRKTDFVKIISSMYDCRIFETINGKYASNKDELIKSIGSFFNTDIKNSSRTLSDSRKNENFLNIFNDITQKATEYYCKINNSDKK